MKRVISSFLAFAFFMEVFSGTASAYMQEKQRTVNIERGINADKELARDVKDVIADNEDFTKKSIEEKKGKSEAELGTYDKSDVNEDGKIDIMDLTLLASHYNEIKDSENWNVKYDINKDSIVDLFDLVFVSTNLKSTDVITDKAKVKSFTTSLPSGQMVNEEILLSATSDLDKNALYEFSVIGDYDNDWTIIKEYNDINESQWIPIKTGNYTLRVRTKHINSKVEYDDELELVFEVIGNIKDVKLYVGNKGKIILNKTATPMLTVTYDDGNSVYKAPDSLKSNSESLIINEVKDVIPIAPGKFILTASYKGIEYTKDILVDDIGDIKSNYDKAVKQGQEPLTDTTMNLEIALNSTKDGIKLNWTDYPIILKYEIYRKAVGTEYVKIADVTNNEFMDKDVVRNEYYDYKINITRQDGSIQTLKEIGILADRKEVTVTTPAKDINKDANINVATAADTNKLLDITKFRELEIQEFKTYLKYAQKYPFVSDGIKDEVFARDPIGVDNTVQIKKNIDASKNIFIQKGNNSDYFSIIWTNDDLVPYKTDEDHLWIKPREGLSFKYNMTTIYRNPNTGKFLYYGTMLNRTNEEFAIDDKGSLVNLTIKDGLYYRDIVSSSERYVLKYTNHDGTIHEPARFFNEEFPGNDGETTSTVEQPELISINKVDIKSEEVLQVTKGLTVIDPELSPYKEGDNLIIVADNGMPFLAKMYKIPAENSIDKFKLLAFPYDLDEFQIANRNMDKLATLSTIMDFTPIAAECKQVVEAIMGKDLITGQELSRLVMIGAIFAPGAADIGIKKLAKRGITKGKPIITNLIKEIPKDSYDEIVQTIAHYLKNDIDNISQVVVLTERTENGIRCYTRAGDIVDVANSSLSMDLQTLLLEFTEATFKTTISKGRVKHILNGHNFNRVYTQFKYQLGNNRVTREKLEEILTETDFFNKDWSEELCIQAAEIVFEKAKEAGFVATNPTARFTANVFGEDITVAFTDGSFSTAWGAYKFKLGDFGL